MKKLSLIITLIVTANSLFAQMNAGKLITKNNLYQVSYESPQKGINVTAGLRHKKFPFTLDTGAPTYISKGLQKKCKFRVLDQAEMGDATGKTVLTDIVIIDTLSFGPFIFCGIPAIVIDLGEFKCENLEGNIGSNVLRFLAVKFDIKQKNIEFTDNTARFNGFKYSPMVVDGQSNVFFDLKINNSLTDKIHFDTGDGLFYHISKSAAEKVAKLYPQAVIRSGYGVTTTGINGIGKPFKQMILKPGDISFSGSHLKDGLVYITGNNVSRLGRAVFNYGVLVLDYINKRYAFEGYKAATQTSKHDFGFYPVVYKNKVLIGTVWEKSVAEKNGLKSGDEIIAINNKAISSVAICDIDSFIKTAFAAQKLSIAFKSKTGKIASASINGSQL